MSETGTNATQRDYGRLMSEARLRGLRELGHDFVEAGADGAYITNAAGPRYLLLRHAWRLDRDQLLTLVRWMELLGDSIQARKQG